MMQTTETKTITSVYFPGDTVRSLGLTVESVRAMFAAGEWPLEIAAEPNWCGDTAIRASLTTEQDADGDASAEEFEETAERTGITHYVSYVGVA